MRLTRRDAVAALAAAGVAVGGGATLLSDSPEKSDESPLDDGTVATLVAAAEVLYPSEVEDTEPFVTRYVQRRNADEPDRATAVADTVAYLDEYTDAWFDAAFASLNRDDRDDAFRRMSVDTADPDPDGSDVERVRYYVVNELLFALYSSPTGGKLVGLENPRGNPGGLGSYQRGPQS
ncbi:MAG: hypothetical protein J07HN6_02611 [Halonotius sp. J07HN6]|nr:MAG: hypothetical protein J07HN6_02611 [Halonotius sp. J07HN6]